MCGDLVEDETHFMTQCRLYGTRDKYWETINNLVPPIATLSNADKYFYLMTQEDPELTKVVLKMVHEWMAFRGFLHENFYSI